MKRFAPPRFKVSSRIARPLLLFDGDCGFCRYWVERWRSATGDRVDYATSQERGRDFPEIPEEEFARSVLLIEPDGEAYSGAEAVFRSLATVRSRSLPLWLYKHVPAFSAVAEALYSFVADHRTAFSRLTRALWGRGPGPIGFSRSRSLFLRLVGLVYLAAFLSLWFQIDGLVGEQGILPMRPWLEAVHLQLGAKSYSLLPTLLWIHPTDATLHLLCGGGALLAAGVVLGLFPAPFLLVLWASYLSLVVVCRDFLGFQWDVLLLEAGFLAVFLAPLRWRCPLRCALPAQRLPLWLLRWLLFRLMFSSGVVKLSSGDQTWHDLTALTYHYETQPLPIWTSWYVHRLPVPVHQVCTLCMFFVELVVPFFIFAPRRVRLVAFWLLVSFQLAIAATGNYAFFNILTVALCFLLVDDASWSAIGLRLRSAAPRWFRRSEDRGAREAGTGQEHAPGAQLPFRSAIGQRIWSTYVFAPFAIVLFVLGTAELVSAFRMRTAWPAPITFLQEVAQPFRTVNGYGLFAVMTTERHEIIVEGSEDGTTWLPYEFKWKPGDTKRRPVLVAPHQPRLDWQMWFAALGDYRSSPWFLELLGRLLQGSPPVLGLLRTNPFPDRPPRYVRALLYDYHFSGAAERRAEGTWWRRELLGTYCPNVSLRGDEETSGLEPKDE